MHIKEILSTNNIYYDDTFTRTKALLFLMGNSGKYDGVSYLSEIVIKGSDFISKDENNNYLYEAIINRKYNDVIHIKSCKPDVICRIIIGDNQYPAIDCILPIVAVPFTHVKLKMWIKSDQQPEDVVVTYRNYTFSVDLAKKLLYNRLDTDMCMYINGACYSK